MARALAVVAVLAPALLVAGRSRAAPPARERFGVERPFVVSVEHLAGVSYQRIKLDQGESRSSIQAGAFTPFVSPATPEARLGVHYFPAPALSLGVLLDYVDNGRYGTSALLGMRAGYALPLTRDFSVWARAGVAWTHTSQTLSLSSATVSNVVPGGDVLVVFSPVPGFGIMAGPMLEVGVAGRQTTVTTLPVTHATESDETSFSYVEAAFTVGVLADF